jgi:hypothetical protein
MVAQSFEIQWLVLSTILDLVPFWLDVIAGIIVMLMTKELSVKIWHI